jgi:hypothetical protein
MRALKALPAILFGAAFGLSESAFAVIPGQPDPADVHIVEQCVADAQKDKADPDRCIGKVSAACRQTATGLSAAETCVNRELVVWSAAANKHFDQLDRLLSDNDAKQALREAQRSDGLAKLKECTFVRLVHKDSSAALAASAMCNLVAVARFDLWLVDQINSFK